PEATDTVTADVNYQQVVINAGANILTDYGNLRAEYRRYDVTDDTPAGLDRTANSFRVSATARLPQYDWLELSGGYSYRLDELDADPTELKTNLGWGGARVFLPHQVIADYRFSFARTDNTAMGLETDNVFNAIAIGKVWPRHGALRVGYENRIADDLTDRTTSSGFMLSGWYRVDRFRFRGEVNTRDENVTKGITRTGDRNNTRNRFSVSYRGDGWGDVTLEWHGRIREHDPSPEIRDTLLVNDDVKTRVDYNTLSARVNLRNETYGRLTASYSVNLGEYRDNSAENTYEFTDHIIRGTIYPREYRHVQLSASGTYYHSKRDLDVEKFNLSFTGRYTFLTDNHLEVRYNVFNFDDFLFTDRYYTANIVEIYITKDLTL
ncbi:MAG: hypothetical protein D6800_00725, partial [Candidatus Zixiibacteriota bacterium]